MFNEDFSNSLLLTGQIILVVTIPLIVFSLLIAYFSQLKNKYLDFIIELIINIPIIFPPIGIGFLLVFCFSKNSIIGQIFDINLVFSFTGICVAAFLTGIPFITRSVIAANNDNLNRLSEAAYTLGRGKINTFVFVIVPLIMNNILHGLILAIGRIVGEVGITMMIGGNIQGKTTTVSLEIYNAVLDGENNRALMLAIILFVFSFMLFYFIRLIGSKI